MKNKGLLVTIFSIVIVALLAITIIFIIGGNNKNDNTDKNNNTEDKPEIKVITDFDEYKGLDTRTDIIKVTIRRFTVAGGHDEVYENYEDIQRLQSKISTIKLGKETQMACEDNTTVYIFETNTGSKINVEIECDWLIIGKKRYLIEK